MESIRLRFALLQSLNSTLETFFLPLIDLRPCISDILTRYVNHKQTQIVLVLFCVWSGQFSETLPRKLSCSCRSSLAVQLILTIYPVFVLNNRSSALLLSKARGSIFYDTKTVLLNRILNATAQRKPDQAAPEISLDPLENVGGQ